MTDMPISSPTLKNIHQILTTSSLHAKSEESEVMIARSHRFEDSEYQLAKEICARNGTDISSFLRLCVHELVQDYSSIPLKELGEQ